MRGPGVDVCMIQGGFFVSCERRSKMLSEHLDAVETSARSAAKEIRGRFDQFERFTGYNMQLMKHPRSKLLVGGPNPMFHETSFSDGEVASIL